MLWRPGLNVALKTATPLPLRAVVLPGIGEPASRNVTVPKVTGEEFRLTVAVNVIGSPSGAVCVEVASLVRLELQEICALIGETSP